MGVADIKTTEVPYNPPPVPPPGADLPTGDANYQAALQDLASRVNGFVYHGRGLSIAHRYGDRLEAVIGTVKALRADPDLARQLLEGSTDGH